MILLKRIQLNNFLSHETSELEFSPSSKLLVDGLSGAGKSSVIDAIIWCLYGEGRTQGKSLIRKGQDSASVELELSVGDTSTVKIVRSITTKAVHKLEVHQREGKGKYKQIPVTGIKAVQEWIEKDLVGASYLLFVNSVAYLQEGSELFVSQPANKRKELLLEIVKAEDYDKYYEDAKKKLQEYALETATITASISTMRTSLERTTGVSMDEKELKELQRNLDKELASHEADLIAAQELEKKYQDGGKKIVALSLDLHVASEKAARIRKELEADELFKQQSAKDVEELKRVSHELADARLSKTQILDRIEFEHLRGKAAEEQAEYVAFMAAKPRAEELDLLKRDEARIKKELEEHAASPVCPSGDKCPYMGKKDIASIIGALSLASEKVIAKEKEIAAWDTLSAKQWTEARKMLELVEQELFLVQNLIDSLAAQETVLVSRVTHKDSEFTAADLLVAEATVADLTRQSAEEKEALEMYNGRLFIDTIHARINTTSVALAGCKASIAEAERFKAETKATQKYIKELEKQLKELAVNTTKVELVKEAFGSKGIRSVVVDYLLPQLEDRVNTVLSKLSGFSIRFDTQAEKTDGGAKEGLFITIINDSGEELPYEAFSGGEKLKITVAISEALATLQKVKFRLFDEMFIGLDQDSTENFAMVLERLQENFPQVVCISHLQQIKDMFADQVLVTKHNGISKLNAR